MVTLEDYAALVDALFYNNPHRHRPIEWYADPANNSLVTALYVDHDLVYDFYRTHFAHISFVHNKTPSLMDIIQFTVELLQHRYLSESDAVNDEEDDASDDALDEPKARTEGSWDGQINYVYRFFTSPDVEAAYRKLEKSGGIQPEAYERVVNYHDPEHSDIGPVEDSDPIVIRKKFKRSLDVPELFLTS